MRTPIDTRMDDQSLPESFSHSWYVQLDSEPQQLISEESSKHKHAYLAFLEPVIPSQKNHDLSLVITGSHPLLEVLLNWMN